MNMNGFAFWTSACAVTLVLIASFVILGSYFECFGSTDDPQILDWLYSSTFFGVHIYLPRLRHLVLTLPYLVLLTKTTCDLFWI